MNLDPNLISDKLGIGDDKVYGVIGEFADPHELVARRTQDSRDGLYQARRDVAVSGARHRRRHRRSVFEAGLDRDLYRLCGTATALAADLVRAARSTIRW